MSGNFVRLFLTLWHTAAVVIIVVMHVVSDMSMLTVPMMAVLGLL